MFKMRLDAEDRERLDAVAAHYSAPAATAIRILIKEKCDSIDARPRSGSTGRSAAGRDGARLGYAR